jgi:hypothetical protein
MFSHFTNTASFFSVLMAALIFSLSQAGVAWAQGNTSLGTDALQSNTTGSFNTAIGFQTLFSNTTGSLNTANGVNALANNMIGDFNTANGVNALLSNTFGGSNTASGYQLATPRDTSTPPLESMRWLSRRMLLSENAVEWSHARSAPSYSRFGLFTA